MHMLHGFHIVEIAGDRELAWITDQVASLPTNPVLNLASVLEHVGLIKHNICFLKEKTHWVPALIRFFAILHLF